MIEKIRSDEDLTAALARLEEIFFAEERTPEDHERSVLSDLIEAYEDEHYPIGLPSPVGAIEFNLDRLGLTERDLIPIIGSQIKVEEVLSGKREITVPMARALGKLLDISMDILLQESGVALTSNDD